MAKKKRHTSFVPRLLVRTAIASVVPACALGCSSSGDTTQGATDTGIVNGVADTAYAPDTRADSAHPDVGVADTAYRDSFFGVADAAYDSAPPDTGADAPADAPGDAASDTAPDVFGVAAVAYPAYEAGTPG